MKHQTYMLSTAKARRGNSLTRPKWSRFLGIHRLLQLLNRRFQLKQLQDRATDVLVRILNVLGRHGEFSNAHLRQHIRDLLGQFRLQSQGTMHNGRPQVRDVRLRRSNRRHGFSSRGTRLDLLHRRVLLGSVPAVIRHRALTSASCFGRATASTATRCGQRADDTLAIALLLLDTLELVAQKHLLVHLRKRSFGEANKLLLSFRLVRCIVPVGELHMVTCAVLFRGVQTLNLLPCNGNFRPDGVVPCLEVFNRPFLFWARGPQDKLIVHNNKPQIKSTAHFKQERRLTLSPIIICQQAKVFIPCKCLNT
eukprot:m.188329 g.188329  ORF g.188329 m.188329 type:complete len:309 (-) comp17386_c0_seq1:392-1318(-)